MGNKTRKRLGEMLVEAGVIDEIQLTVALGMQKESGLKLGKQLLKLGFVDEDLLSQFLKEDSDLGISLINRNVSPQAVSAVPQELAFQYRVMPVAYDGRTIVLAMSNPSDLETLDALAFRLGKRIHPVRAFEWDIENALLKYYTQFSAEELDRLTNVSSTARQYQDMDWNTGNNISVEDMAEAEAAIRSLEPLEEKPSPAERVPPDTGLPPEMVMTIAEDPADEPAPSTVRAEFPPTDEPAPRPVKANISPVEEAAPPPPRGNASPTPKAAAKYAASQESQHSRKRSTVVQAVIELLLEKEVLTEQELLRKIMLLEGKTLDGE